MRFVRAARISFCFALVVIGVAWWVGQTAPFRGARGWHRPFVPPVLALELPESAEELHSVALGAVDAARKNTAADLWFIVAYGLFFASLAYVHKTQRAPYHDLLWFSTIVFGAVTVVFDLLENYLILRNLLLMEQGSREIAGVIVPISAAKWFAFFAVMLLAAPIFTRRVGWRFAAGAALTFFSSLGMIGCVGLWWMMSSRAVITVALSGVMAAMFAGVIGLATRPWRLLPPTAGAEPPAAAPGYIASRGGQSRPVTSDPQPS